MTVLSLPILWAFGTYPQKAIPHEVVGGLSNGIGSAFDIFPERYLLEKIRSWRHIYMIVERRAGADKTTTVVAIADMALEVLQTLGNTPLHLTNTA